jgi:tetratricopeptide (TPR) repeat protein
MDNIPSLFQTAEHFYSAGDLAQAEAACRAILAADPRHAQSLHLLGAIALRAGQPQRALEHLAAALGHAPDTAEVQNELGNLLQDAGQLDEAIACFERARRLLPGTPQIHYNLGNALRALGQSQAAERSYREALRLAPDFAPAHNNLGTLRQSLGDLAEAEHCYRQAVRCEPRYAEAHYNLGVVLEKRGDLDAAQASYERAIALDPNHAPAHNNLGVVFQSRQQSDEARRCFYEALRASPRFGEPYSNLGILSMAMGQYAEAREHFAKSLEIQPDLAESHYNLGMLMLLHGEFEAGWQHYAWHQRCARFGGQAFPQPTWDGSPLSGRTILVHCDHGLGDTMHFVRYVDEIRRRGAGRILLGAQRALYPLLAASGYADVLSTDASLPSFDVHATVLGLPAIFRDNEKTIPADVPYLRTKPELVERWREPLARLEGFRVGIAWQGSRKLTGPDWRPIPLAEFEELARVPGVHLISLQRGPGSEQIHELAGRFRVSELGKEVDRDRGAFMDTAAIIRHLDLVITCDSAVAHLAGALGASVWVALPSAPDWRWLLAREDSPWYPTVRLFRQQTLGDWSLPFAKMREQLAGRVRRDND